MLGRTGFQGALLLAVAPALVLLVSCEGETKQLEFEAEGAAKQVESPSRASTESTVDFDSDAAAHLGRGFVVWESNRTGDWRIWTRRLDGLGLRQLTADEPGRQHCCAHISPDGERLAYLSFRGARNRYLDGTETGSLRLVQADGSGERELVATARNYFENRAAVWRSATGLVLIMGDGRTALLDVDSGEREILVRDASQEHGWLLNATLTHATGGLPSFSPFNRGGGRVAPRRVLGGCQPYFSHDGRWGYWVAGAGGPVHRIDLASREISTVLRKNDSRLPSGQAYLYFPMSSRDGRLFAVGASRGGHDHNRSDYDVFVMETDPRTLEVVGNAVRYTFDGASDRYPDVFAEPLALGDHAGEVPFELRLESGDAHEWTWERGDGRRSVGPSVSYRFETPGVYRVTATRQDDLKVGMVRVSAATPPRLVRVALTDGGMRAVMSFDEPLSTGDLKVSRESAGPIAGWSEIDGGRSLAVELGAPLRTPDRLVLEGIADRAQRPNVLRTLTVDLEPPLWPGNEDSLAFLWQSADAANLVRDREAGVDRAPTLTATGRATFDRAFAMLLDGGVFVADSDTSRLLIAEARRTNELSVELTLTSRAPSESGLILSLGSARRRDLVLFQRGMSLWFHSRSKPPGAKAWSPAVELFELEPGRSTHVVVIYQPGILRAYRDGELVVDSAATQGDFFHWRQGQLVFGSGWLGTIEGVAVYSRVLGTSEVAENAGRYAALRAERPEVAQVVIEGTRLRMATPARLEDIEPYREALVVSEYRVDRVVSGSLEDEIVRVAEWTILGGEVQPHSPERGQLTLEAFDDNPQLEGVVLGLSLEREHIPLYYSVP